MKTMTVVAAATALFVAGAGAGIAATKINNHAAYHDRAPHDAATALLEAGWLQAGKGSWERIAVGRVYYLGGEKAKGQAIFDAVLEDDPEHSDEMRIAEVYAEAGEWDRAKPLFDSSLRGKDMDETDLATIGAYYMLNGDRARAEQLFDRSFADKAEVWATVTAAGSYLGIKPQQ
jgi:tetratricopeptide (TPR) repeat protein